MATNVEKLTPSLRGNAKAVAMAKDLDSKTAQLAKWREAAKETSGRPSRVKRSLCTQGGVTATSLLVGMFDSNVVRGLVATVVAAGTMTVGAAAESDVLFDAGNGAAAIPNYLASSKLSNTVKNGLMAMFSGEGAEDAADPAVEPDPATTL